MIRVMGTLLTVNFSAFSQLSVFDQLSAINQFIPTQTVYSVLHLALFVYLHFAFCAILLTIKTLYNPPWTLAINVCFEIFPCDHRLTVFMSTGNDFKRARFQMILKIIKSVVQINAVIKTIKSIK